MIIVIDGYNLLKQIFPGSKGTLEKQRTQFIHQLSYYKKQKAPKIKDIITVFDAGPFNHASREVKAGIVVIYSGQKSDADTWIIDYVERVKNQEILVISNDRKLISECAQFGASNMSSHDFYNIMQDNVIEHAQTALKEPDEQNAVNIKKYKDSNVWNDDIESTQKSFDAQALDLLMEQESLNITKELHQDDEEIAQNKRQSKKTTLSKHEKKAYAKLKKL